MLAVILAAGFATRMYPLTKNKAKTLLPLKGKLIIDNIVEKLFEAPLSKVIVVSNNSFFGDFLDWKKNSPFSDKIVLVNNMIDSPEASLGWLHDLSLAVPKIDEDFLVVASDLLFGFSVKDFVRDFSSLPRIAVCDIHSIEAAKKYGVVEISGNKIVSFEEKPLSPKSTLKASLFYLFPEKVKNLVRKLESSGEKKHLLELLFSEGVSVEAFVFDEYLYDVGSIEGYEKVKTIFEKN